MRAKETQITLELGEFYSKGDEARFFAALEAVPAVKELKGRGTSLIISLALGQLKSEDLVELLAVARRYGLSRKPFKALSQRFSLFRGAGWQSVLNDRE